MLYIRVMVSFTPLRPAPLRQGAMLTLKSGSACDVCAEEYAPQCLPHSIPCGMFLNFSLRLAQPSQAMFSVPVAPLLSSKKQPHASSQHVLFAVSLFLQIRSVSFAWTSLPADGARPAVIPTLSLATILLESSWQSARNSSCALIPTPAQSRRHAAWRTKSLGSQPKNLLLKRCLLFRRNLRTGSGPPRGTNKILLFSSVLPCCGLFS